MSTLDRLRQGIETTAAAETIALGRQLAAELPPDCVLALHGDLGSGKTTLVSGLASGWGIAGPVTSPTYNLFTLHRGQRLLAHLDAYRLNHGRDMDALMLEEFLVSPWCLAVEWPDKIEGWLPPHTLHLDLTATSEASRTIKLRDGRGLPKE